MKPLCIHSYYTQCHINSFLYGSRTYTSRDEIDSRIYLRVYRRCQDNTVNKESTPNTFDLYICRIGSEITH